MREGGVCVTDIHAYTYPTEWKETKQVGGHKKGEIYTDTKQEMELCEILEQKRSLDCPNLGHEQC